MKAQAPPCINPAPMRAACDTTGEALYVEDVATRRNSLVVHLAVTSPHAHARITARDGAAALKYLACAPVLFSHDIPGDPLIGPIVHDEPVLALDTVHYAGQAVAMVVGESYEACRAGAEAVRVDYEVLPALTTIDEALAAKSFLTDEHRIARGDLEAALAQADVVIEERTESGAQDHFYLETQATLATRFENGCMHLLSSTQHPTEVQRMAALVLGKGAHEITLRDAAYGRRLWR